MYEEKGNIHTMLCGMLGRMADYFIKFI